jgi:hypothetical protein
MFVDKRVERGGVVLAMVALAGVAGVFFGGVTLGKLVSAGLEPAAPRENVQEPTLAQRLSRVDAALARNNLSQAVYEWRDAYGVALGTRRWEAMVDVGDAATRIDVLAGRPSGHPTGFRAEARQAYLRALFQARHTRSLEGIERVAQAFAALGDHEMAARARAIVVTP